MPKIKKLLLPLLILLLSGAAAILWSDTLRNAIARLLSRPIPIYTYKIVNSWPHDPTAFTEGLLFKDDHLYESTGRNGQSSMRIVDLGTGRIQNEVDLVDQYFGEGIAILDGRIFQLTWLDHKGFIYDQENLSSLGGFTYEGEGWGLTDDGHSLIMSNGTNGITFLNPQSFAIEKVIHVYDDDQPLTALNELEYVNGEIYANIWHSDKIVGIDPGSGRILGWIDLSGLFPIEERPEQEAVLNGIAYDESTDRLFVTGKLWPRIFEIQLEETQPH